MEYAEARDKIATGDCIAVKTAHGMFGWLTQFFTYSKYVHTGVAIWINDGLWMAEINRGFNHLVPLSQMQGVEFDVFSAPAGVSPALLERAVYEKLRVREPYSYLAVLVIGFIEFFGFRFNVPWRKELVCSGYVVSIYEHAGWTGRSYIISPERLVGQLEIKLSVEV